MAKLIAAVRMSRLDTKLASRLARALVAPNGNVYVERINLHAESAAAGPLGRHERGARA